MNPIGYLLSPLPDFIADHTLLSPEQPARIREVCARWVQFVGSLWKWRNKAAFCLRFRGEAGRVSVMLLAMPDHDADPQELDLDIRTLLQSYRLLKNPAANRLSASQIAEWSHLERPHLIRVTQHSSFDSISSGDYETKAAGKAKTPVIFGWWGPGGPFLLPMEALVGQAGPVTLSIYLQPTDLMASESEWLKGMAAKAASAGEQTEQIPMGNASVRKADPVSSLAGRLYLANHRRLVVNPFLVSVHCAAEHENRVSARNMASMLQGIVSEIPFQISAEDEDALPSGSDAVEFDANDAEKAAQRESELDQYSNLFFSSLKSFQKIKEMARLPFLADAKGAATVFRLPVSVNGGVPGAEVRQLPPDFHPGPRQSVLTAGQVKLGDLEFGGVAALPLKAFTKHALITGFTGSGKTTTVLQLLHQFWIDHGVPFLVIESAKHEYRGLMEVKRWREKDRELARLHPEERKKPSPMLRVYTLGNERCAPFRFNPFEIGPGVRVESHLSRLATCFQAALPNLGMLPSVMAEALTNIYQAKGWQMTDLGPANAQAQGVQFPTMSDLYAAIGPIVEKRYSGEVKTNITGAIEGRIKPFTRLIPGSRSAMIDVPYSNPSMTELFENPTILEMNDLNEEDKSMLVLFLLTALREYREMQPNPERTLKHITVVEEAHNVLEKAQSVGGAEGGGSDTKYKAVQSFCNMLSEVRAYGEGLIIADQSPNKLATDAIRNTNVQIAHQLRDSHDRESIASAMLMTKEQEDFIGKLETGEAAVFFTGLQKATFIRVARFHPESEDMAHESWRKQWKKHGLASEEAATEAAFKVFKAKQQTELPGYGFQHLSDEKVRAHMAGLTGAKPLTCELCRAAGDCQYRGRILAAVEKTRGGFVKAYQRYELEDARAQGLKDKGEKRIAVQTNNLQLFEDWVKMAQNTMKLSPDQGQVALCWVDRMLAAINKEALTNDRQRERFLNAFREWTKQRDTD